MADTREVLPVVTDDDYKELDPAPAVPSSEGTYPGGQLSPNPKMSPDVKEDGVRATEKHENTAPGEQFTGPLNAGAVRRLSKEEALKVVTEALSHLDVSDRLVVSDITALTNEQIATLKNGDFVIESGRTYVVALLNNASLQLVSVSDDKIFSVVYLKDGSDWIYDDTYNFPLNIGSGLATDNDALQVHPRPEGGIEVTSAGVAVKLAQDGGLEIDDGALKLETPIWKKIITTAVYDEDNSVWDLDNLPNFMGNEIIMKFKDNGNNDNTLVFFNGDVILNGNKVNSQDYMNSYDFNADNSSSYIQFTDDMPLADTDVAFTIYYKDYQGVEMAL